MKLRLYDTWKLDTFYKSSSSLAFSRSDRRNNGVNLSRIDRVYVSDFIRDIGGQVSIIPGTCFCDHSPVLIQLVENKR